MVNDRMGHENIWKLIGRMTLPTIAAQLINMLYSIVDRIYIGHIPEEGQIALTGVGLATPIVVVIAAFSLFVGNGGAPLASIALGQKDRSRAEQILGNGVSFLIGLSAILPALCILFAEPILYATGASDATFGYAHSYLMLYIIGTPMVMINMGLTPFVLAQGKTMIATLSMVLGAFVNIALDPLFIYTFDLGVRGAAIATVIAQAASAAPVLYFLLFKTELRIRAACLRPHLKTLGRIASLGIAPFVMAATESVIGFVLNGNLQAYGNDLYVGCLTVMQSVMQLITVPVSGFVQGVSPIISFNYGAGNKGRVKKTFRIMLLLLCSYMALLVSFIILFPAFFAAIFTSDPALIRLTEQAMPIFMAGMLIFGLQRSCQTAFLALGQAKFSLFFALWRKIILLVPLAIILPRFFGVMGIYYAEPIADSIAALTCCTVFLLNFNKILNKPPK
ncbi:MAG: MATE family efflux transporter [Clostridia bacterium]|nr:MATE family efflux transporter [Clostridia bacterium]